MPDRVLKVTFEGETLRLSFGLQPDITSEGILIVVRSIVQRGFGLCEGSRLAFRYTDDEGDLCILNASSVQDWLALSPEGALRLSAHLPALVEGLSSSERGSTQGVRSVIGTVVAVDTHDDAGSKASREANEESTNLNRLVRLVRSSDENIRRSATDALCKAAATGDIAALTNLRPLTSHDDEHVRRVSADALCIAAAKGNGEALAALESMASSCDENIRRAAAAILGSGSGIISGAAADPPFKRPRRESGAEAAIDELHEQLVALRLDAVAGNEEAIVCLIEMTHGPRERVRYAAAEALVAASTVGHHNAIASLAPLASHGDEHIRRTVTKALVVAACDGHRGAADALNPLTQNSDEHVRRTAAEALCSHVFVGHPGRGTTLERLAHHSDEHIRRLATGALCRDM